MSLSLYITPEELPNEIGYLLCGARLRAPEVEFALGEFVPKAYLPVVACNQVFLAHGFFMEWGYPTISKLKKTAGQEIRIDSIRLDKAAEDPMFLDGYRQRRCLIPVTCYYETVKKGGKTYRYKISPVGRDYMFLGGIYRKRNDKPYVLIVTGPAPENLTEVGKYAPIIVPREYGWRWVNPDMRPKRLLPHLGGQVEYTLVEE